MATLTRVEFGTGVGPVDGDVRFIIPGNGAKNALAITISYESLLANGTRPAFQDTTFYGRLLVAEGNSFPDTPVDLNTPIEQQTYLDLAIPGLGPYTFLFPLTSLQGSVQTSQGGILAVVLGRAFTAVGGQTFRGRISVAGQTLLPSLNI